jgi:hypothetical protein
MPYAFPSAYLSKGPSCRLMVNLFLTTSSLWAESVAAVVLPPAELVLAAHSM